jgi:aminoglycoside phosphotransferase (APT) family kinase protein
MGYATLNLKEPLQVKRLLLSAEFAALIAAWVRGPAEVKLLSGGDRCLVYEVRSRAGRCVIRFPQNHFQEIDISREATLCGALRSRVCLEIPHITFFAAQDARPACAVYPWIEGEPLTTDMYQTMSAETRQRLVDDLADFLAATHAVDLQEAARWCGLSGFCPTPDVVTRLGKPDWFAATQAKADALLKPHLDEGLATLLDQTSAAFDALESRGDDPVFGHGDLHGFNLAMRPTREGFRLGGIFDFGSAGIQDMHIDFFRLNFIGTDLLRRVVQAYEERTGGRRRLDPARIEIYWRAFLFYLMAEHLEGSHMAQFEQVRGLLVDHMQGKR